LNEGRRKKEEGRRKKEVYICGFKPQFKTGHLRKIGVLKLLLMLQEAIQGWLEVASEREVEIP
jgi:hypothetical protein